MPNEQPNYLAGGTIAPCIFVKPDASNDNKVLLAGAASDPCGVSQEGQKRTPGLSGSDAAIAAESGDPLQVFGFGQICLLTIGAAVAVGDWLKPDGSGYGITASSGDIAGARALKAGTASGQKIPVLVFRTKA